MSVKQETPGSVDTRAADEVQTPVDDDTSKQSSNSAPAQNSEQDRAKVYTTDRREKLQKKLSSVDLHSRLKSRKLLGVGATDDGQDIHRSKVSQILGHNEMILNANRAHNHQGLAQWGALLWIVTMLWSIAPYILSEEYQALVFGSVPTCQILYQTTIFCFSLMLMAVSLAPLHHSLEVWMLVSVELFLTVHIGVGFYHAEALRPSFCLLSLLLVGNTCFLATAVMPDTIRYLSSSRCRQPGEDNSNRYFSNKKLN